MAWFSNLAGKAETFLENLDQAAATSLDKVGISTPSKQAQSLLEEKQRLKNEEEQSLLTSDSFLGPSRPIQPHTRQGRGSTPTSPVDKKSLDVSKETPSKADVDEESLLAFLNSPTPRDRQGTGRKPSGRSASSKQRTSSGVRTSTTGRRDETDGPSKKQSKKPKSPPPTGDSQSRPLTLTHPDTPISVTSLPSADTQPLPITATDDDKEILVSHVTTSPETTPTKSSSSIFDVSWLNTLEVREPTSEGGQPDGRGGTDHTPGDNVQSGDTHVETVQPDVQHSETEDVRRDPMDDGEVEDPEVTEMKVKLSNLDLENKLLRREISSLNEEMSDSGTRLKQLQDNNARYQQEIMLSKERISSLERELTLSLSTLQNVKDELSVKCEDYDVMKKKLFETEQEMEKTKESLIQTTTENSRLVRDASDISGAHTSTLNNLRQQLNAAQQSLTRETHSFQKTKEALEDEKDSLMKELLVVKEELQRNQQLLTERTVSDGQKREKLDTLAMDFSRLQKEYQEYKHKATSILQMKEQEIARMRSDGTGSSDVVEQAELEKDLLEDKLAKYESLNADLRSELRTVEEGAEAEISRLEATLAVTKENLVREQNSHSELQLEMGKLRSELDQSRMELRQQSSTFTTQIKEKDEAIQELESRWALMSAPSTPGSGGELETRLQELTESLIEKQTLLETMSSEKHSLQIQLEKTKSELEKKEASVLVQQNKESVVISGLDDAEHKDAVSRMRSISSIIPSTIGTSDSSKLSRNVHKAATVLDTFSVRLGVFLRRHPQARLFVIFYGVLLHLWVMFVLMFYKPEVHPPTDSP